MKKPAKACRPRSSEKKPVCERSGPPACPIRWWPCHPLNRFFVKCVAPSVRRTCPKVRSSEPSIFGPLQVCVRSRRNHEHNLACGLIPLVLRTVETLPRSDTAGFCDDATRAIRIYTIAQETCRIGVGVGGGADGSPRVDGGRGGGPGDATSEQSQSMVC